MKKYIIILTLIFLTAYKFWYSDEKRYPPGILVPSNPQQININTPISWEHNGYQITSLAGLNLEARVLHKKRYIFDRESELSPIDLALGWGPMSDQRILDKIDISQSKRWYHWYSDELPIPARLINLNSANMHMIPANSEIENLLKSVIIGDIITIKGYLVSARANDGWFWKSSLSRADTGDGACEVIWVQSLSIQE